MKDDFVRRPLIVWAIDTSQTLDQWRLADPISEYYNLTISPFHHFTISPPPLTIAVARATLQRAVLAVPAVGAEAGAVGAHAVRRAPRGVGGELVKW